MHEGKRPRKHRSLVSLIFALVLAGLATTALAKAPHAYPVEGKVVAIGTNQVNRTRTYKVVTDTRVYELDCGKRPPLFSSTPGECGGDKNLSIGDVIHFRIEKQKAYIPVSEGVEPAGEQALRILREELTEAKPHGQ